MRRYNIESRILLILTVITFALAAPTLVQDKRQAYVDVVHVPEDVTTVLRKRMNEQELQNLWNDLGERIYQNVWRNPNPAGIRLVPAPPEVHVPPPNPAGVHVPEVLAPPQNPAEVPPQNPAEVLPQNPADSDHESMDLEYGAPPTSPTSSTESEDWYTAPSSLGSSTESASESESDRWSTISTAPSTESLSENPNAADSEMRSKAKVERHISGTGVQFEVDMVNVAQLELRTPGHYPKTEETGWHGSANPMDF